MSMKEMLMRSNAPIPKGWGNQHIIQIEPQREETRMDVWGNVAGSFYDEQH